MNNHLWFHMSAFNFIFCGQFNFSFILFLFFGSFSHKLLLVGKIEELVCMQHALDIDFVGRKQIRSVENDTPLISRLKWLLMAQRHLIDRFLQVHLHLHFISQFFKYYRCMYLTKLVCVLLFHLRPSKRVEQLAMSRVCSIFAQCSWP